MPRKDPPKPVVTRLPITQAQINLDAVVKRVYLNKEYIIIEKDGIPIAGIMDIDEFEDYLELQDPEVRDHIQQSSDEYRAGQSRPVEDFLSALPPSTGKPTKASRRQQT